MERLADPPSSPGGLLFRPDNFLCLLFYSLNCDMINHCITTSRGIIMVFSVPKEVLLVDFIALSGTFSCCSLPL